MGLNSLVFIPQFVVLVMVLLMLQLIRSKRWEHRVVRVQETILLFYSYFFIGWADWRFSICVIMVTNFTYCCGLLIERYKQEKQISKTKKTLFVGGLTLMLVLGYFKYTNFFINGVNQAFGLDISTVKIILPLGLSFFTFSAFSYLADVYRGACKAERDLLEFALYMALFTKITAGPIVRWLDFKPQIKEYRGIKLYALKQGVQIFAFGLFKKMVLADHLGVFVDDVFRTPRAFNTTTVILSAISYSLQIYLDFSGYSDMAIGLSKVIGFNYRANFNLPYISRGFSEFWERWHISLSQWFRDYLYIPLGGSRKGEVRTYNNLLVTMLVSGLWHGAGWTFILWGGLHGIASCFTRLIKKNNARFFYGNLFYKLISAMLTFILVTLFWTVFRADSIEHLQQYWKALFTLHGGINQPYTWTFVALICVFVATTVAILRSKIENLEQIQSFYPILGLTKIWELVSFFTFVGLTILLGYYGNTAFIYGGF
jgi:membrane bound O-acyl transferase MBOAT family protein